MYVLVEARKIATHKCRQDLVRRSVCDNSGMIFSVSLRKHMLLVLVRSAPVRRF